jgi:hypothetical protein
MGLNRSQQIPWVKTAKAANWPPFELSIVSPDYPEVF